MKRIIPIFLIIVIIICIVLPFAVSADSYGDYSLLYYDTLSPSYTVGDHSVNQVNITYSLYNNSNGVTTTKTINCTYISIVTYNDHIRLNFYTDSNKSTPYISYFYYPSLDKFIFIISVIGSSRSVPVSNIINYNHRLIYTKDGNSGYTCSIFFDRDFSTYEIGIPFFHIASSNLYHINFNSNGGSSISSINDIEYNSLVRLSDIHNNYLPEYIPNKLGYIFDYWYLTDAPLQAIKNITVNQNIILNAKWSRDPSLAYITFGDGFYSDINHSVALTDGYYEIGSYIDFYTSYSGSKIYRGKVSFTDLNDDISYYQGPSGNYKYHIQVTESGTFNLVLLDYCTTYVSLYPDVEGTYVSHIQYAIQDGEWHNYTFDDPLTIQPGYQLHFRFYLTAPYVITEGVYYYSLIDYENIFIRSDVKTNNDWQTFWSEVYVDFTVNHSGTLYLYVKSISDYDITSRDIVGIYDESTGEFSWAVSEVSLLDTNWEDVVSNIPQNLAYMFDGIYSLSGLAIIVPLCMMVAFGLWFIRRS